MTERERLLDDLRPVAFAIAYRMLGSVSEAEDIVQEALLRVHRALEDGERIQSPPEFVATVTTRLAINELHSARARREQYVGEWLPEPIITDGSDDPAQHAQMADSLSLAMLVLLERLTPEQRAVLLLHDVFDSADRRRRARDRRRSDPQHQLDRQPRQARPPRPNSRSGLPAAHTRARQLRAGSPNSNRADNHRNVHIDPRRSQMSTAQTTSNIATVTRFHDATSTGDLELISKTIDEVVEPDAVIHTPLPIQATGPQLLKEVFARLHGAFPDLHITIEDLIEEGDKVVSRNTVTGTHQGEYMGIPSTGKSVTYDEIFILRLVNGRFAETWGSSTSSRR
jgi:RNA polymerase sigma factor (sigma-70 family)